MSKFEVNTGGYYQVSFWKGDRFNGARFVRISLGYSEKQLAKDRLAASNRYYNRLVGMT